MSALTPQDIQSKQFHVRFRGFDVDEVDVFLEKIAEDFLTLIQENKQLREKIDSLGDEIDSYREQERAFKQAILSAQKIADDMKMKGRLEAEEMLAVAKNETQSLRKQAHGEVTRLGKEIQTLEAKKEQMRSGLETFLHAYLEGLDSLDEMTCPTAGAGPVATVPSEPTAAAAHGSPLAAMENRPASPPLTASPKMEELADLSDLYEKVDLGDDFAHAPDGPTLPEGPQTEEELREIQQSHRRAMPDINGDMMFKLEDPLDEKEPDIPIFGRK